MGACLIIKNDGIGDLILASGIINHISAHFAGELDLVCCDASRALASEIIEARNVIGVSRDPHFTLPTIRGRWPHRAVRDVGRAIKNRPTPMDLEVRARLAATEYDLAIVLRRYVRQSTFYIMSSVVADRRVSLWQYPTNLSMRRANRLSAGWERLGGHAPLHEHDYYRAALSSLFPGLDRVSLPSEALDRSPEPDTFPNRIALVLGSVGKGLGPEVWTSIVHSLAQKGSYVEVFGGQDTLRKFSFLGRIGGVSVRAGQGSLEETAEYITASFDTVIGNDTGLVHRIAPKMRKVIVVCSGETPLRFFPWPEARNQYVIYRSLSCFDCGYCTRAVRQCIKMDQKQILLAIHGILMGHHDPGVIDIGPAARFPIARRWASLEPMTLREGR